MSGLRDRIFRRGLRLDGAMGTSLQERGVPAAAWRGHEGCNEWLNLTAPELIAGIHRDFFAAGSDAVETNTFGASPLTLAEFDLADRAREINRAAARLARAAAADAATPARPRFVFGSIGPGVKLPTLGQVSYEQLYGALQEQITGLAEGGVDGLLFETCQDPLQIKAGLAAADAVLGAKPDCVIAISVTVEQTGTLLIGSSIAAALAILAPYPIDVLGLNCATGPAAMRIHLDYLAANWPGALLCQPNAGLPVMEGARVRYPLAPEDFARALGGLAREVGLHVVGGCCGTTPAHLRALCAALADYRPPVRAPVPQPEQAASIFQAVDLTQQPAPLYVGERANATGSKKFREALLADRHDEAFHLLTEQEETGAHVVDLSCAYAGRDERADMVRLAARAARECRLPVMFDSTQADVIEAALQHYGGRALINSINFEDGEARAERVAGLARRYGAALVGLTIDEAGMAMTAARKLEIARRLVAFCRDRFGLRPGDLFIDPLTFTVGSGDETLRTAAVETLDAIRRIKAELPGVRTLLGLSNISFGLKPVARRALNSVFLDRALKAGLDACIIHVAQIVPLADLPPDAARVAAALLDNDWSAGDPLAALINFFEGARPEEDTAAAAAARPPEARLAEAIIKGQNRHLADAAGALLADRPAEDILNELLIPAMKEVGRLFNDGRLQLPFVLKSAEVMKQAVDLLKPHMKREDGGARRGKMVIATVAGDVHDIGKNLVDIILSNNGFTVINLGTKVPVERMIAAVREHGADVLGMSGLLVKSALVMVENLKALAAADVRLPVFLGGAALTPEFVRDQCAPVYPGPVAYCRDAFAGLARMREWSEAGRLAPDAPPPPPPAVSAAPAAPADPVREQPAAIPPFRGARQSEVLPLEPIYALLNETALVRGRWGFRRGALTAEEYETVLRETVRPKLAELKARGAEWFEPRAAWGYFPCRSAGETLHVRPRDGADEIPLVFPRQSRPPGYCIADFFRRDADTAGFLVVTLGPRVEVETARRMAAGQYQDYLLLHGFAVEVTDALAEFWHKKMRAELGFPDPEGLTLQDYITQQYRGSRYGFGYPSCPDLTHNRVACDLVGAAAIGVRLSENCMMIPEVTTSALVSVHPRAKYFFV